MSATVIVLASGRGERFLASGGTVHKLHARLGPKTVLEHTLSAVQASGLSWHLEDQGHAGMGDSIAAAVRATPDASAWLILPADLPLIQPCTLRRLARVAPQADVLRPFHAGQPGHPVRFGRRCGPALQALHGHQGAARIMREFSVLEISVEDIGCVTDIDTLQDLERAQEILQGRMHGAIKGG